ncbi:hypothetical protein J6590_053203 [Homalodisca vitripennis]|nr:hypothetical protein J6590_053203 [Homalodisca vitripennis]
MGKYLAELGVLPTDTRHKLGRGRFHLYTISHSHDVESKYLAELGVLPTDTRHKLGRGRFHLYTISHSHDVESKYLAELGVLPTDTRHKLGRGRFHLYTISHSHDVESKYLAELGVLPTDTRDKLGRGRFHLYTISQLVVPGDIEFLSKYWKSSIYPVKQGNDCCHPLSITFRGTSKATVYFHHYLLYNVHLHIEAGRLGNVKSDTFTPSDEIWQQFVLDELGPNVNLSSITPKKFYNLWVDKLDSPSIFNKKLRALFGGDSDD